MKPRPQAIGSITEEACRLNSHLSMHGFALKNARLVASDRITIDGIFAMRYECKLCDWSSLWFFGSGA